MNEITQRFNKLYVALGGMSEKDGPALQRLPRDGFKLFSEDFIPTTKAPTIDIDFFKVNIYDLQDMYDNPHVASCEALVDFVFNDQFFNVFGKGSTVKFMKPQSVSGSGLGIHRRFSVVDPKSIYTTQDGIRMNQQCLLLLHH